MLDMLAVVLFGAVGLGLFDALGGGSAASGPGDDGAPDQPEVPDEPQTPDQPADPEPSEPDPPEPARPGPGNDLLASPEMLANKSAAVAAGIDVDDFDAEVALDDDFMDQSKDGIDLGAGNDLAWLDGIPSKELSRIGKIEMGAGDDIVVDSADKMRADRPEIYGGEGNDHLELYGFIRVVEGGPGEDTIMIKNAYYGKISGGAGDDKMHIVGDYSDHVKVTGDAGDDWIDVRGSANIDVNGGEGNDVIMSSGGVTYGDGYWKEFNGGPGDDILIHEESVLSDVQIYSGLYGGEGADRFVLIVDEGELIEGQNGFVPAKAVWFVDFKPGEDFASIQPKLTKPGFTLGEPSLEENIERNYTTLTLNFEHPTELTHEVKVFISGVGLTSKDYEILPPI